MIEMQELSRNRASDSNWVGGQGRNAADQSLGFMKNAKLSQDGSAIIVDLLSCEAVVSIEGVNAAERDFDLPSRCWQSSPCPKMRAANHDLDHDGVIGHVHLLHV